MLNKKTMIPKDLITKIKFDLDLSSYNDRNEVTITFNNDESELFDFCYHWFAKILDSYGFYKVDVGQYLGLFPLELNMDKMKVYFNIDQIKPGDWKDWFLEDKDTPLTHYYLDFELENI